MLHGKLFMIGQGRFMSQCDNKINSRSTFKWLLAQDMTLGVNQKSLKKGLCLISGVTDLTFLKALSKPLS